MTLHLSIFLTASLLLSHQLQADCTLKTTWDDWEPLQFEVDGLITGIDNDLIKVIANKSGCKLDFHKRPWARSLKEIAHGHMDFTAAASITDERRAYGHYSISYRNETMIMLVKKGDSIKYPFKTIEDIADTNFILGVTRGAFYGDKFDTAITKAGVKSQLHYTPGYYKNFRKLLSGHIHGVLGDKMSLMYTAKKDGVLDRVEIHPLPINSDKVYLMFSKKSVSPDTVEKINKSINQLKANGELEKIINQYIQ